MRPFFFLWLFMWLTKCSAYYAFPQIPIVPMVPHAYPLWPEIFAWEPPRRVRQTPRWQAMAELERALALSRPPRRIRRQKDPTIEQEGMWYLAKDPDTEEEVVSLRVGGFRHLHKIQASLSADGNILTLKGARRSDDTSTVRTRESKVVRLEMPFRPAEPTAVRVIHDRDGVISVVVPREAAAAPERDHELRVVTAPDTASAAMAIEEQSNDKSADTGVAKPSVDGTEAALDEKFGFVVVDKPNPPVESTPEPVSRETNKSPEDYTLDKCEEEEPDEVPEEAYEDLLGA